MKKELDSLKADLSEAETKGKEVRKEYEDGVQHLRDVQQQFRTADDIRQKAYGHWRDLKNESIEKVCYLFTFRNSWWSLSSCLNLDDIIIAWFNCLLLVPSI